MGVLWLASALALLVGAVPLIGWLRTRRCSAVSAIEYHAEAFDDLVRGELRVPNSRSLQAAGLPDEDRSLRIITDPSLELASATSHAASVPAWAPPADIAIPALRLWERWSALDKHVFGAFERLTHTQLESVADLSRVIDAKGYQIQTAAFQRMLKGHVAEAYVTEHAAEAGLGVEMPQASNYPGTDAWLDGHAVNVKAVSDVGSLGHHFERYPDVAAIVPVDAENIPDDALHFDPRHPIDFEQLSDSNPVIVDDALSGADVADQVGDGMDFVDEPAMDVGVPWVTVAISSLREGRLLLAGSTDATRAARNVAIDGVGVGGGAIVGAKAGAIAGSFFGPVGTAVGSVLGGVVGGMTGRKAAAEIRRQPLVDAIAVVKSAQDSYQAAAAEVANDVSARWTATRSAEQEQLRAHAEAERRDHDSAIQSIRDVLAAALVPEPAEAISMLDAAETEVDALVSQASQELASAAAGPRRWLARVFAPAQWAKLQRTKRDTAQWRARAEQIRSQLPLRWSEARELYNLVLAVPGQRDLIRKRVVAIQAIRIRAMTALAVRSGSVFKRCLELRSAASARLEKRWYELQRDANARMEPRIAQLKSAIAGCDVERRRAGVK